MLKELCYELKEKKSYVGAQLHSLCRPTSRVCFKWQWQRGGASPPCCVMEGCIRPGITQLRTHPDNEPLTPAFCDNALSIQRAPQEPPGKGRVPFSNHDLFLFRGCVCVCVTKFEECNAMSVQSGQCHMSGPEQTQCWVKETDLSFPLVSVLQNSFIFDLKVIFGCFSFQGDDVRLEASLRIFYLFT